MIHFHIFQHLSVIMSISNQDDTFDLFSEIEKWHEAPDMLDVWASAFVRINLNESLQELEELIVTEPSDTILQNSTPNPYYINPKRCLINQFECVSTDFRLGDTPLCSTPLSKKNQSMEELRFFNQSSEHNKIHLYIANQETMSLSDTYSSFLSISLESPTVTPPKYDDKVPELEYTHCSSLKTIDVLNISPIYITDYLLNIKECPINGSHWENHEKTTPLLENKYIS